MSKIEKLRRDMVDMTTTDDLTALEKMKGILRLRFIEIDKFYTNRSGDGGVALAAVAQAYIKVMEEERKLTRRQPE